MYLRPDEVARVLEGSGFERDYVDDKSYGYRRGGYYVYVNREARLGRTALVIDPSLKERSIRFATPTSPSRVSPTYTQFPADPQSEGALHYGIPHGFSSRQLLSSYLENVFK
ncbi:DUF2002 family protein [Edaphovirga cremea]|uniref:DUF2002 family protein n=1 Tax=Edaphovirga cremea TaxID=2267246 RepID=UPI000DEEC82F|nr:DUF2002 family protein [Edaphovirga cremea]